MGRLEGKTVIVTGATSGIGVDIARRAAEEGARVAVCGRNKKRGAEISGSIGPAAKFIPLDVSSEQSWIEAIDMVEADIGPVSVLVNNAGVMTPASIEDTTTELFQSIIMTNTGGVFYGSKHAISRMKANEKPCSIVNVLSTTALKTSAWTMAYGASKAAALSITRSIALHCAEQRYPIRCNAVLPGVVLTPMVETMIEAAPDRDAALGELVKSHPIGRLVTGEEVANAVIYYASDESTGVTGSYFTVDGGMTAG